MWVSTNESSGVPVRALHEVRDLQRGAMPFSLGPAELLPVVLEEIDYGLILLSPEHLVLHVNQAAQQVLQDQHPIEIAGKTLGVRQSNELIVLREALIGASHRGLRRIINLGPTDRATSVAVIPLPSSPGTANHVLLALGKPQVGSNLAVQSFARTHFLSRGEEQVLRLLCDGHLPQEIADMNGVKIATVRTQIANVRAKTGAQSIRHLVQQVALLPPMVTVAPTRPGD